MKRRVSSIWSLPFLFFIGLSLACQPITEDDPSQDSESKAVDIPHTSIKWQSIGNCWSYAALGWAESLILRNLGEVTNFSESYMTYRHFESQIVNGASEVRTGGSFLWARSLMRQYGLLIEGDFIPVEAERSRSARQEQAVAYLNASLNEGALKDPARRTPELIRRELDRAFGVRLADVSSKILYPDEIATADDRTLADDLAAVREISLSPGSSRSKPEASLPEEPTAYSERETLLMRRVMQALNNDYPVVINWFVDFNALNEEGRFDLETLRVEGSGRQGYHSTVIEDYTAAGVDSEGQTFEVGEGLAPESQQQLAATYGRLTSIIVKNSWGGAERRDRPSYEVDDERGYHRLEANYLFGYMREYDQDDPSRFVRAVRGITSFIVPTN